MPNLILKKPSDLEKPLAINYIYANAAGTSIACHCPECGIEHEYHDEWPIDIPIICGTLTDGEICKCRFIIPNNVSIED